jgi:hypothetical protein
MSDAVIACPHCKGEIKLNESLAAPLVDATRKEYELKLSTQAKHMADREADLLRQQTALADAKAKIDEQVASKLATERDRITKVALEAARATIAEEVQNQNKQVENLNNLLKQRTEKLAEAQAEQAKLLEAQRKLDDEKRELDLTIQKRVNESLTEVRDKAKLEAEDALKLKVQERDQKISGMQKQIEDLMRRAEQGSQQQQGEVLELELERQLQENFPRDTIQPVPKGEFGGDILHQVFGPSGTLCGTILWESKRTKHWSDTWLPKLRTDQRTAGAEMALIITQAMPKEFSSFGIVEGIWVAEPRYAIPLATALRQTLLEVHSVRKTQDGQQTKMDMVYQYLTGPRFRHRVEAIVERFSDMQADLDKERKTMTRLWAKRQQQIQGVIENTAGMYGDLQGIVGRTLQEIDGLEISLISDERPDTNDASDEA